VPDRDARTCEICGAPVVGHRNRKYCGDDCRVEARRERERGDPRRAERNKARKARRKAEGRCERCYSQMAMPGATRCESCAKRSSIDATRWNKANPVRRRISRATRRAKKYGAGSDPKGVREEVHRQLRNPICRLCGKKLKRMGGRFVYHVDHILPISRGGDHKPLNVQVTCPTCNLRKNDKGPGELGFLDFWGEPR
jgi:5-methylcytosine-specific restriction endonuclease McrA